MGDEEPDTLYRDGLLRVERTEQPAGVRLVGEVDLSNAQGFARALASAGPGELVVDLSRCQHMGSAGIGAIIETWQRAEGRIRVHLVGASPTIRYALRVSGIDRFEGIQIEDRPGDGAS
jgi:anti-anti-sigma factor